MKSSKPVTKTHGSSNTLIILSCCGILGLITILLRIPLLDLPFFGSHLFRQLQTLSTIEAYIREGSINLLSPKTNYIGYPGVLLLECPLFQAFAAGVSTLVDKNPLVVTKTLNLILGLLSTIWVYKISNIFTGKTASTFAAYIYLIAPLNLMYHASTLIDPMAVFTTLIATHVFLKHTSQPNQKLKRISIATFLLSSILTVLIKPLFLFPLAFFLIVDAVSNCKLNPEKTDAIRVFITKRLPLWIPIITAGFILLVWLKISSALSEAQDVTSHLGWIELKKTSFYITILLRYLFYIQSPTVLLISSLGLPFLFALNKQHRNFYLICWILPFAYYLVFANINRPHDYYSLILVPFVSLSAGLGVEKTIGFLNSYKKSNVQLWLVPTITLLFLSNIFLYLFNYWITPNTTNRYQEFSEKAEKTLEPFCYSLVFVDKNGPFKLNEYLAESRRDIILAKIGKLNEKQLRRKILPIYDPAILYALNHQYGEVNWYYHHLDTSVINSKIQEYEGNLRYLIVLMPSNPEKIKHTLSQFKLEAEFENMLVYNTES